MIDWRVGGGWGGRWRRGSRGRWTLSGLRSSVDVASRANYQTNGVNAADEMASGDESSEEAEKKKKEEEEEEDEEVIHVNLMGQIAKY